MEIPLPHNKKTIESFLRKTTFIIRFIHGFAKIVRPMQDMIKKDHIFKWGTIDKYYF